MANLTGGTYHQLDDRSRAVLPSKIREIVGSVIYLHFNEKLGAIEGMLPETYENLAEAYNELFDEDPETAEDFFANTYETAIDTQGRFVINPYLKGKAHIESQIRTTAMHKRIVIRAADGEIPEVSKESKVDMRTRAEQLVRAKKEREER